MSNSVTEYIGKHRGEMPAVKHSDALACMSAMTKIASALRGVPNESPRHAYDPTGPFTAASVDARQKLLAAKRSAS